MCCDVAESKSVSIVKAAHTVKPKDLPSIERWPTLGLMDQRDFLLCVTDATTGAIYRLDAESRELRVVVSRGPRAVALVSSIP